MLKYLFIAFLSFAFSFDVIAEPMNIAELQQSLKLLVQGKKDTAEVELLLRLAHRYIYKAGEEKKDMDSAALLISKAETLSATLKYPKGMAGYVCNRQYLHGKNRNGKKGGYFATAPYYYVQSISNLFC